MKKIAFMFVAAAMFVACGEKKAAQEAEAPIVEENTPEVVIEDSIVWKAVGDTTGLDSAAIAEIFASKKDSLIKELQTPSGENTESTQEEAAQ